MPTVACCTLGCKVNQYDTQAMLERLEADGYAPVPFEARADIYLINTCTVTGTGDQKSRQMIRRAARLNDKAAIIVTGCLAQRKAESLLLPGVRLVLGTQRRGEIARLLRKALSQNEPLIAVDGLDGAHFEALTVHASEGRTRATLKIQEGCRNHCAYCVIPSVRGPVRSRPLADTRAEAERLAEAGFREIVVTGIHLASYGLDFEDGTSLADALREIAAVEAVRRIRLGSLEPLIVDEAFVTFLKDNPKICRHFMLALQSGSDGVLKRMGRRYDTARYAHAAALLRDAFPDCALTTDVMAGFPGETDAEFEETLAFVESMRFARIHVFPYSRREGTRAAAMPNQIPRAVKEARASALRALGAQMEAAYVARWVGREVEVLFETAGEGYTPEYVRVRASGEPDSFSRVRILSAQDSFAQGVVAREESGTI